MILKTNFRLFIFLLALLPVFNSCAKPKALAYQDMQNFRVHSVNLQQVVFAMDLRFYNPNKMSLDLKNGDIDAFVNDKYFGKALLDEQVKIPANDTFSLPVTFQASLTDLLGNAWSMLGNSSSEVLVRMKGSIRAGKAGIFLPVPIFYEGKQKIEW